MIRYVDYDYYQMNFRSNIIPWESFDNMSLQASIFIRDITFNRIDENNITDDTKDAVCAVCDIIYKDQQELKMTSGRDIKSESTDGYSVTYITDRSDGESHDDVLRRKMYMAARPYLIHTGMLYRGSLNDN